MTYSVIAAKQLYASMAKDIPLGRVGRAEEVANAIAFPTSEAASYITGTGINLDGGTSAVLKAGELQAPENRKENSMTKAFDLAGRVAIVTGGNGGIGLGMATGLAQAGAALAIAGRNANKNAAAVKALQALGAKAAAVEADVTQQPACQALIAAALDHFGRLDILVNNAGINIRKQPQDYTLEEWKSVLDANLTSAFLCSQAAYPAMLKAGGGKIINIGSMLSIFGAAFAGPYGASKGGMVQLTKSLASAWAKDDIQVNAVLPGWIDTALTRAARKDVAGLHERVLARTPAGRWGDPADFAGIAVFLASSAADFVTGAAIPVDGGYSSQG